MNARDLLATRGRRTIATLLTYMEENVWPELPDEVRMHVQAAARSKILSVLGDYQDLAMDLIASEDATINEFWVEELARLHDRIGRLDGKPAQISHSR
jgi:hypothetical protein